MTPSAIGSCDLEPSYQMEWTWDRVLTAGSTHPLEKNDHSHHMSNATEMIIAIIPASKLPGYLVVWRSYSKWRLAIWFGVISKEERSNTRCTRCKRSCQDTESNPNPNPTLGSSTTFLTTWLPWHRWKNWPFIDYMFLYMHVSLHIFEYYCAT